MVEPFDLKKAQSDIIIQSRAARKDDIVLASSVDDLQIAVGIAGYVNGNYPGWYIKLIYVTPERQAEGHGYTLVSELLQRLVDDGIENVYLLRPKKEGRAFQGGFGFEEVEAVGNMTLFKASPSNPSWTR